MLGRLVVLLQVIYPGVVGGPNDLDSKLIACHSTQLPIRRKGDIANRESAARQEPFECVGLQGIQAHSAVLGADYKEIVIGGDADILLLAVVDVGWFSVKASLVDADCVVGPDGDQL